jgi:hypothetical protein
MPRYMQGNGGADNSAAGTLNNGAGADAGAGKEGENTGGSAPGGSAGASTLGGSAGTDNQGSGGAGSESSGGTSSRSPSIELIDPPNEAIRPYGTARVTFRVRLRGVDDHQLSRIELHKDPPSETILPLATAPAPGTPNEYELNWEPAKGGPLTVWAKAVFDNPTKEIRTPPTRVWIHRRNVNDAVDTIFADVNAGENGRELAVSKLAELLINDGAPFRISNLGIDLLATMFERDSDKLFLILRTAGGEWPAAGRSVKLRDYFSDDKPQDAIAITLAHAWAETALPKVFELARAHGAGAPNPYLAALVARSTNQNFVSHTGFIDQYSSKFDASVHHFDRQRANFGSPEKFSKELAELATRPAVVERFARLSDDKGPHPGGNVKDDNNLHAAFIRAVADAQVVRDSTALFVFEEAVVSHVDTPGIADALARLLAARSGLNLLDSALGHSLESEAPVCSLRRGLKTLYAATIFNHSAHEKTREKVQLAAFARATAALNEFRTHDGTPATAIMDPTKVDHAGRHVGALIQANLLACVKPQLTVQQRTKATEILVSYLMRAVKWSPVFETYIEKQLPGVLAQHQGKPVPEIVEALIPLLAQKLSEQTPSAALGAEYRTLASELCDAKDFACDTFLNGIGKLCPTCGTNVECPG